MNTPRVIREAEDILRIYGDWDPRFGPMPAPPWQGECVHLCLHATVGSRERDSGLRCCRCNVVVLLEKLSA